MIIILKNYNNVKDVFNAVRGYRPLYIVGNCKGQELSEMLKDSEVCHSVIFTEESFINS